MVKVNDIFELDVNGYSEIEADGFEFIEDLISDEDAAIPGIQLRPLRGRWKWLHGQAA